MIGNLLQVALQNIPPQPVKYQKFLGFVTLANGIRAPQYADPVEVMGSVQKVAGKTMHQLGLDFQNNYRRVWLPADVKGLQGQLSNDVVLFGGKRWTVTSQDNWFDYPMQGWVSLIVCEDKDYNG